jgi:uncharacterized protein (TIGR02186 family)
VRYSLKMLISPLPLGEGWVRGATQYILLIIFIFFAPTPSHSSPLVAEISSHDITIHTAFHGTELILFGVRDAAGDIVVVVRGPERRAVVRKKERIFGVWANRDSESFDNVPAFYAMAASRNFEAITKSIYFDALQIGYAEAIHPFRLSRDDFFTEDERAKREVFARALLREFRTRRLYQTEVLPITFISGGLFRTTIPFPDNTPTGTYTAEVYLFADGEVMGVYTTPIRVYKSGFDAFLFRTAHEYPAAYGVAAILLAVIGGITAIKLFHRN